MNRQSATPFLSKVRQALERWVPKGSRVLVAVSGGADSLSLLHALYILRSEYPLHLVVGHVDHGLRTGSARDARFVKALSRRLDLPCVVRRVRITRADRRQTRSLEDAARRIRYAALVRMAGRKRCRFVLTAHTQDDQAETLVMRLLRGVGPAGLAGIPPMRRLTARLRRGSPRAARMGVVRPLLELSREQVLAYLAHHRLSFRQDPTNRSMRFMRNRIRHRVLPYLESFSPGLRKRLASLAERMRQIVRGGFGRIGLP